MCVHIGKKMYVPPHNIPFGQWYKGVNKLVNNSHVLPFGTPQMFDKFFQLRSSYQPLKETSLNQTIRGTRL